MKIAGSCAFSSRSRVRGGVALLFPSARHRLARSETPPCRLPAPVVRRTSSVGRSPTRRSDTAPAIHRTRKTGILCTALRDYALKAAVQHIKHRRKSASTGRIAQYSSRFFIGKSPTLPVKTAHFRTKVPVFRPFSGRCDTICAKSTF